ncbi:MAG: MarR family winged helix-turn-helix transcriptional regulator [Bacillota bacterium]
MEKEAFRQSFNTFLKLYFDSCKEVYEELDIKGMTDRQFKYLRTIDEHGSMTVSELAKQFGISKPTMTEVMHKFETAGFIKKKRCDDDGRVINITLTKRGALIAKTNVLESNRAVEKLYDRLDEEEMKTLKKLFDKIRQVAS